MVETYGLNIVAFNIGIFECFVAVMVSNFLKSMSTSL